MPARHPPVGCPPVEDQGIHQISAHRIPARHPVRIGLAAAVLVAVVAGLGACADDDAADEAGSVPTTSEDASWVRYGHDLANSRLSIVASDLEDDQIPSGWTQVPDRTMVTFTRTDEPELESV